MELIQDHFSNFPPVKILSRKLDQCPSERCFLTMSQDPKRVKHIESADGVTSSSWSPCCVGVVISYIQVMFTVETVSAVCLFWLYALLALTVLWTVIGWMSNYGQGLAHIVQARQCCVRRVFRRCAWMSLCFPRWPVTCSANVPSISRACQFLPADHSTTVGCFLCDDLISGCHEWF